jgi:hypothetical protein
LTDAKPQEILPPSKTADQFELFEQALEVERERIRSQDKRTEVVRAAIDANDASDKRQFEFHMAKLKADRDTQTENLEIEKTRLKIAIGVVVSVGLSCVGLVFLFCYMLFFGTSGQSSLAMSILTTLGQGVGGFGIIYAAIIAFRTLLKRR